MTASYHFCCKCVTHERGWHYLYFRFFFQYHHYPYLLQDIPFLFESTHLGDIPDVCSRQNPCLPSSPSSITSWTLHRLGELLAPRTQNRHSPERQNKSEGRTTPRCLAHLLTSLKGIINHLLLLGHHSCRTN